MKTADLSGPALDWAVAKCDPERNRTWDCTVWFPSTVWGQGGPIIEREKIDLTWVFSHELWEARIYLHDEFVERNGYTPLIAAMRCYVASKLGDEVDIPKELQ